MAIDYQVMDFVRRISYTFQYFPKIIRVQKIWCYYLNSNLDLKFSGTSFERRTFKRAPQSVDLLVQSTSNFGDQTLNFKPSQVDLL